MIIGIDGNEANVNEKVGIGEYAFELLWQFYESQKSSFDSAQDKNIKYQIYLKDKPREDLPKANGNWSYKVFGPKKFWTQLALPLNLYSSNPKPDVFFTPSHYAPRFSPIPTVISIMDLSYIHFPEMFKSSDLYQLENWTKYSVKKAKKIFTISKASKDDIIKEYQVAPDRIVVTYPGIKKVLEYKVLSMDEISEKYGIKGDYILFVGTLQPRKNLVRLIEAFSKIKNQKSKIKTKDLELVIVGKKGWMYEDILGAPKKFGVESKVKFLDFVSDEELPSLYKNALCFVLPSLYEGFGLPVLESMKYGCPVITSSVSSLPEAGGDAALYVDPLSVNDIATKIKMVIEDKKLRQSLIEKGKKQVEKFSWEKTAKETLKTLEEVAKE